MRSRQGTIRARVPLRLGLAGGGTDLSPYCDEYGGAVLNTTIDRYAYAFIEPSGDGRVHFVAPDLEIKESIAPDLGSVAQCQLTLHAAVARRMLTQFGGGSVQPMRVTSYVDAPPGSGLGSSSALVVALVEAFSALLAAPLGPYDVAHIAFEIERIDLGLAGGKQDQYAATFGGTNFIEFHAGDRVIVNPLRVAHAVLNELETSMVVCFTGVSRRSEAIIVEQQRGMAQHTDVIQPTLTQGRPAHVSPAHVGTVIDSPIHVGTVIDSLHQLKHDAVEMKEALLRGQIPRMADILNRSWEAKKRTASGISTGRIEALYELAFSHGAIGGKVSGAGGGGFMMFIVPPDRRIGVVRALNAAGGTASGVHLTSQGAESWTI